MIHFFYSFISLVIAIFFILLGIICVILPWSSGMQSLAISLLVDNGVLIFLFGLSFLAIGFATALHILLSTRRQYYHLKVCDQPVSVDAMLIQNYLHTYLKELFPDIDVPNRVEIKKNNIHVTLDLPFVEPENQEIVLERIKSELKEIFSSLLGYHQQFYLYASFQPPARTSSSI